MRRLLFPTNRINPLWTAWLAWKSLSRDRFARCKTRRPGFAISSRLAVCVVCGLMVASTPLAAQQGRARVGESAATEREPRPQGESYHVAAISPELEQVLREWYDKTKSIERLQGTHTRWMYERTFFSGSVARGNFYYESPDKGRIDIKPAETEDADSSQDGVQIRDTTGNIYTYKECPSQSWICDGKRIVEVNHEERTFEAMPIPPAQQGKNIMDGPLPFLFGMPPEKAKARYDMKIDQNPELTNDNTVCLIVKPRLKQDASNWGEAQVILYRKSFLPYAVKLISQNGISSTVYIFDDHEVNNFNLLKVFGVTPFKPPALYAQVQNKNPAPPAAVQPLRKNGKPIQGVPSVAGLSFSDAKTILGQRGYRTVQVIPTATPCEPKMKHRVKAQSPKPGAEVSPEQPIQLILYATQEDIDTYNQKLKQNEQLNQQLQRNRDPQRTASKP